MAWSNVAGATAIVGGSSGGVTVTFDSTNVDFIAAAFCWYYGITANPTLTDDTSGSNTWNGLTAIIDNVESKVRIYWCRPSVKSATHSLTLAGPSIFASGATYGFTGSDATPFDQESGTDGDTQQPGSITPSGANYLFITAAGLRAGSGYTVDSGFTYQNVGYSGGAHEGLGLAYLIQSGGPAGVNPMWDTAGATTQATFKVSSGGGSLLPFVAVDMANMADMRGMRG